MFSRSLSLCVLAALPSTFAAITFEPNRGQTDPRVQFLTRTPQGGVLFATSEKEIILHRADSPAIRLFFENANPQAQWQGLEPTGNKVHYRIGRDAKRHTSGLDTFYKLTRKSVYPGIDLVLYGNSKNELEYDLVLAPLADPSKIRLHVADARIDERTGDLVIGKGAARQRKPVVSQNNKIIAGRFKQINRNTFGFEIASYDRSQPLVIDPVIESRDYIGGIGEDSVTSVGPRNSVAGTTTSIDFPGTPVKLRHGKDVFYRRDGVTYIMGGSGDDIAATCDLSETDANPFFPVIAGTTNSTDLPTRSGDNIAAGSIQASFAGGATDGFLWNTGSNIVTYFGGAGDDRIAAITKYDSRFAIVGSTNGGSDFPLNVHSTVKPAPLGGFDAFLATGSAGSYSQFFVNSVFRFGGAGDDHGLAILGSLTLDRNEIIIAGETFSPSVAAAQGTRSGPSDGFLARYSDAARSAPILFRGAMLFGGSGADRIHTLAWSTTRNVIYAAGSTSSTDLPVRQAAQASFGGGPLDAFYATLNPDLTKVNIATYLGGTGTDEGLAIAADNAGNAYLGGRTTSTNLTQRNPSQSGFAGGATDALFAQYDSTGAARQVAYYGGSGNDEILVLGYTQTGFVTAGGSTTSIDLPGVGVSPLNPRRFGTTEGFVTRFGTGSIALPATATSARDSRLTVPIGIGDPLKNLQSGRVTARSSDGSRVRITFYAKGPAVAEDNLVWRDYPPRELHVECLTDDGEATVTVSTAGVGDGTMRVRCVQPELRLEGTASIRMLHNLSSFPISVQATDPVTGEVFRLTDAITPGLTPRRVVIESSNSQVVIPVNAWNQPDSTFALGDFLRLLPFIPGTTVLTASAPGYKSFSTPLTVEPVNGAHQVIELLPGAVWLDRATSSNSKISTVIRSTNASRVLLGDAAGAAPSGQQITVTGAESYYVFVKADAPIGSETGIEMSTNGAPFSLVRTVRVVDGVTRYRISGGALSPSVVDLMVGESKDFQILPGLPETQLPVISSSNPAVVAAPPPGYQFRLTGLSEGTSQISFRQVPGSFQFLDGPMTVRVSKRALLPVPEFPLGNGLVETRTVTGLVPSPGSITISTSTPNLLQLERTPGSGLASSITFAANDYPTFSFRVHGKASLGEGLITISATGYDPITTKVRLYPAGFFWGAEDSRLPWTSLLELGPVDPVTGMPLAGQPFSDPNGKPTPVIDTVSVGPGESLNTIRQPAGFATAVIRQVLRTVESPPPPVGSNQNLLRMNIVGNGTIGGTFNCAAPTCFIDVSGSVTTRLTANPAPGHIFVGWQGDCSGIGSCDTTVSGSRDVTAVFAVDTGLHFLPIAPCRIVDTRNPNGPLGGPAVQGTRNFPVRGTCGMPASAAAYSLNVTVVPRGTLGYISIWPGGQSQPVVSTLNSLDGRIKANAAIVPAGASDGSINLFATDLTDVILDVNGVFVPKTSTAVGQSFYPVTPCRIVDTRLRGGALQPLGTTGFAVAGAGGCGIPVTATAYALNVTVVPQRPLGFLTIWPGSSSSVRPTVSTLNALTGTVTANAAIVPSGTNGDINVYATDATHMILDVTGYFAPPDQANALSFRPLPPCRAVDTRFPNLILEPGQRGFSVECGVPANAKAFSLNATVLPAAILGYLTLYPPGSIPLASTLNAVDGALTSNAAIVPAGLESSIIALVTERTHLILDINGYFAP